MQTVRTDAFLPSVQMVPVHQTGVTVLRVTPWPPAPQRVTTCPCCTGRPSLGMPRKVML